MPNSGVSGTVRDENGTPLPGLVVHVNQTRFWSNPELASAEVGATGAFLVQYPALDEPDLEIVVTDAIGRRVAERRETGVIDQTLDLQAWTVPAADATGWAASTGAFATTTGTAIDLLIDNEEAWSAVLDAVTTATTSIDFMLFYLDVGHAFMSFDPDPPVATGAGPTTGERLEDALAAAGATIPVRLLLNDFIGIPCPADTAGVVTSHFRNTPGVETRRSRMPPLAPVHAKVLIVDAVEAYVIGSPFVQDYYDGHEHRLRDPRHGEERLSKAINVPTHDVSLRLRGPAVAHLHETFRMHWNQARPAEPPLPAIPTPAAEPGGMTTQITRTLWGGGFFTARPQGETSIYEAYLRAIASAERYVYLENQYFTLRELAAALVRALKRNPALEVVLLTNNKVDIPLYSTWHPANVTRLLSGLTAAERGRVGVFTLWTHEPSAGAGEPSRVGRIYVHSKVAIVDDEWATVGSANLDGVSLLLSEHADVLNIDDVRATEANVVVYGAAAGGSATTLPGDLRRALWAEHLGFVDGAGVPDPAAPELTGAAPAGGWLGLWRERATAKLDGLRGTTATVEPQRVLPWPHQGGVTPSGIATAASYLQAFGIAPTGTPPSFAIAETFDYYDFGNDEWA